MSVPKTMFIYLLVIEKIIFIRLVKLWLTSSDGRDWLTGGDDKEEK